MPLQVRTCSTASYNTLATLDQFKSAIGISTSDTTNDESYQLYLEGATDAIEGSVGRILREQVYEERLAGEGSLYLQLCQWPVRDVESIKYGLIGGVSTPLTTDRWDLTDSETGLLYREYTWPWTVRGNYGLNVTPLPSEPLPWYIVVYTAGYQSTTSTSTSPNVRRLPSDLVLATLDTAKSWWHLRERPAMIESQKVDDLMIKYREGGFAGVNRYPSLPMEAAAVVSRYADLLT